MNVEIIGKSEHLIKSYPEHNHDFWEIIYNTHGSGEILIGSKNFDFNIGSILVIPPKTNHYKFSSNCYSDIYIQIDSLPFTEAFTVEDDSDNNFKTLLEMSYKIFHKRDTDYREIINSIWNTMLQILIKLKNENKGNSKIEEFKSEIINHISDPDFKISNLLNKTNYSADHFRRIFKTETGETPVAYLQGLRINYAKLLLKSRSNSNLEISDIAYMSGFYDQRYFGRLFKKYTGLTPTEYSKK